MNKRRDFSQPWLRRFMERGGLTLINAVVSFPLICYALRRWTSLDWFYAALVAAVLSVIAAQILLLPMALLLQLAFPAVCREVCPACGERQLVLGMRVPSRAAIRAPHSAFALARCRRCKRRFRWYDDGTLTQLRPDA